MDRRVRENLGPDQAGNGGESSFSSWLYPVGGVGLAVCSVLTLALLSSLIDIHRAVPLESTQEYTAELTARDSWICILLSLWVLGFLLLIAAGAARMAKCKVQKPFLITGGIELFLVEIAIIAFSFTNFNITYSFSPMDSFLDVLDPDCLGAADKTRTCSTGQFAVVCPSNNCTPFDGRWQCGISCMPRACSTSPASNRAPLARNAQNTR
jgi:hypothetical protein